MIDTQTGNGKMTDRAKPTLEDLAKPEREARDDGGPAFPLDPMVSERHYGHSDSYHGMTLRDYFAGKALLGNLASGELFDDDATLARHCYEYADAMLKARNR